MYEKVLLALVVAIKNWRPYLLGGSFIIRIDHNSWKYLLVFKMLNRDGYPSCLDMSFVLNTSRALKTRWFMPCLEGITLMSQYL